MKIGQIRSQILKDNGKFTGIKLTAAYLEDTTQRVREISFVYNAFTLNFQGLIESVLSSVSNNKPLPDFVSEVSF